MHFVGLYRAMIAQCTVQKKNTHTQNRTDLEFRHFLAIIFSNIFNSLKPTGHVMHQHFNIQQMYALPHTVFMCFVFISEQTATCATYSIN